MGLDERTTTSRFATLSRADLAVVVPELLLIGHLIDRAGMAWCIAELGREAMVEIAIEEWAAASPIYTRRMQRALGFAPDEPGRGDVVTIFKGLQLDIGAPPQFMDFRYTVHDRWHGEFHLDHCGALMDVEPMGPDYVRGMCHDIEDPTFDATAIASNPKAQVRPIHRPPRVPADRAPHCAWTVIIDESYPDAEGVPALAVNERSRAATLELAAIEGAEDGLAAYDGPLLADLDFSAFSRSALVRLADEVCLQMALLDRAFTLALEARCDAEQVLRIRRKQLVGIAGLGAERLVRALPQLFGDGSEAAALQLLALHPLLNPGAYVGLVHQQAEGLQVLPSPAHEDGAWVSLCLSADEEPWTAAFDAVVRAVDPHLAVEAEQAGDGWELRVVRRPDPAPEPEELAVTRFSTGADFAFEPRRSLPITPV